MEVSKQVSAGLSVLEDEQSPPRCFYMGTIRGTILLALQGEQESSGTIKPTAPGLGLTCGRVYTCV